MRFITAQDASDNWRAGVEYEGSPATSDDPRAARLEQCAEQAESIILNYLKVVDDSPQWEPEESDLPNVQAAVLLVGKALYDGDHEAQERVMSATGIVPLILARLRDPAIA